MVLAPRPLAALSLVLVLSSCSRDASRTQVQALEQSLAEQSKLITALGANLDVAVADRPAPDDVGAQAILEQLTSIDDRMAELAMKVAALEQRSLGASPNGDSEATASLQLERAFDAARSSAPTAAVDHFFAALRSTTNIAQTFGAGLDLLEVLHATGDIDSLIAADRVAGALDNAVSFLPAEAIEQGRTRLDDWFLAQAPALPGDLPTVWTLQLNIEALRREAQALPAPIRDIAYLELQRSWEREAAALDLTDKEGVAQLATLQAELEQLRLELLAAEYPEAGATAQAWSNAVLVLRDKSYPTVEAKNARELLEAGLEIEQQLSDFAAVVPQAAAQLDEARDRLRDLVFIESWLRAQAALTVLDEQKSSDATPYAKAARLAPHLGPGLPTLVLAELEQQWNKWYESADKEDQRTLLKLRVTGGVQ